ncbi:folate transporter [Chloropicon primus]|uniref:Folate transporter n=2 Tax=Chloropicon primus TaxID=1764295 RepID=A0A5B8MUD2_9CHLO|nr:folate transporter [Chloropicon primus]UPR03137.1 folate transporter [Chloropicon primus]|eukprot:QDZ23926.1 folate transporter [Chloropicon primus]
MRGDSMQERLLGDEASSPDFRRGGRKEKDQGAWSLHHVALYTLYAFLLFFKPSEAFLVDFLLSRNIEGVDSEKDLSRSVLAVFTYSRMPALLLCLLLCRVCGCKAVVVLGSLCGLGMTFLTITAGSLPVLQLSQLLAAFAFAGHIAFDALQFSGVTAEGFQIVSHFTKGFTLASCCVSSLLGQFLRNSVGGSTLFAITMAFEGLACIVALLLPGGGGGDRGGEVAPQRPDSAQGQGGSRWGSAKGSPFFEVWQSMWKGQVFLWVLLWVFCYAAHDLVLTNWQILAEVKLEQYSMRNLNGYMWSAGYMVSAVLTLVTSSCKGLYAYCPFIMVGAPLIMGLALFGMGLSTIASFYSSFVFFQAAFQLTAAVRNASIARDVGATREGGVDRVFVLSAILWAASGAGVGFEAMIQGLIQSVASLSFADEVVWVALGVILSVVSFFFASFFLVCRVKRERRKRRRGI